MKKSYFSLKSTKQLKGIYRIYPIATSRGKPTWPGKYPNKKSIEAERSRIMDEITWQREHMLRVIYDESYIYKPEDFTRYEILPPTQKISFILIAIDLAISKKASADKTAMLPHTSLDPIRI